MIGLTHFVQRTAPTAPELDLKKAKAVIQKIDAILDWDRRVEQERDTKFLKLGKYLCEVRTNQYWRAENLRSFDEFLERRFPNSRRKAYYLMAIEEHLPERLRPELEQVGWAKASELVKLARVEGEQLDCATWLHKAKTLTRDAFKQEVERALTGDSEPYELVYFKLYKSQLPVVEQALDTAALMLGSDRSRGYCLEMICADFLAGAHSDSPDILIPALRRVLLCMKDGDRLRLLATLSEDRNAP